MTIEQGRQLLIQAKERIHAHRAVGFFDAAYGQLNREPNDGPQWLARLPHVWLLIAKWALASWTPKDDRSDPSDDDICDVFRLTWDAIGQLQAVDGHPAIFFRRTILQQVWLQRSFDTSALARQYRIIGELMSGSPIAKRFTQTVGITAADFTIQLAHMAADAGSALNLIAMVEQRPETPRDPDHWLAVRACYSRTVAELHDEMSTLVAKETPAEVEVCEQSALIRTPFLDVKTYGPVCIHPKLLFRMLETAVFDLHRSFGARPFMDIFGPAFEDYVAEVLDDLNGHVIRENELKTRLVGSGRVVDFALVSEDALVLIDAKGIEGHYDELYHNLPTELAERLRSSLLRAVDQAVATLTRLPVDLRRAEVYFLCVTFKQVAVTDGSALKELTNGTEEWVHERWDAKGLTPPRMLFASIYEFESLIALAGARHESLSQVVRKIVAENADSSTSKALLEMHIMAHQTPLVPPTCVREAARRLRR